MGGSGSGGSSEESRSGRSSRGTITDTGGSSSVDPSSSEQVSWYRQDGRIREQERKTGNESLDGSHVMKGREDINEEV